MRPEQREAVEQRIHRSACFQRVFAGPEGKKVMDWIDDFAGYRNDTFDPDPYMSARNAGMRAVSIFIHNVVEQDVENATKLLEQEKENAKKRKV